MHTKWKSQHFSPNFNSFCTKLTFLHQNWYWQKHLSLCLKVCTTLFYHCTWKLTHLPKNWRFLHKMLFLLKESNATKNWHFSKTEDTSFRKLNISFKKLTFLKMVTICYKNEIILQNCCFCKIFAFTSEAHITEKFTLPKQIVIFFRIDN